MARTMAAQGAFLALALLAVSVGSCAAFAPSAAVGRLGAGLRGSRVAVRMPRMVSGGGGEGEKGKKKTMDRPLGDNIVTQAIYSLEMMRVKAFSEKPTEENNNWEGEPRAWAEETSVAQRVSVLSQKGPFAAFKQWIARSIAGEYDAAAINKRIDDAIEGSPVVMFSFTTCPFCLKAKKLLLEEIGIKEGALTVIECDEDPEGNAIRAELGARTGRTSMPSVWVRGAGYLGGCNDGPGVVPLYKEGELQKMLKAAGAL